MDKQNKKDNNQAPPEPQKTEIDPIRDHSAKGTAIVASGQPVSNGVDLLKEQIAKLEKEKDEYLNGWKRAKADYINLQKDEMKQLGEVLKFGNAELIKELLTVLDSFELSLMATKDPEARKGIEIIYSQLEKILNKQGLGKIKALGEKFDPALHETMMQEESDKESGTILEEMVKGWKLNDKVIRPTKVKIAK